MVLISFKDLYEIHIFPEFHRCGSKIVPATPFWNLNFKWAWQAQFLSHNLLSLQNCLFFTNKEMMLVSFFEINDGIWDKNFACHCHIHFLSHPWATTDPRYSLACKEGAKFAFLQWFSLNLAHIRTLITNGVHPTLVVLF